MVRNVPFLAVEDRPEWFFGLEQALVNSGLCKWDGSNHPQDYALVVANFFSDMTGSYTLDYLQSKPTLCTSQADDLKIETDSYRVWLSRCSVEDGEPYDHKVTVEHLIEGSWQVTETYAAM